MIIIKSPEEIDLMREAGRITANALVVAGEAVRPGITTSELDAIVRKYIRSQSAEPSFLGYGGFPGSACISVNEEVIHGIPGGRRLMDGDIVSVDVGAIYKGYNGDSANTFPVGKVSQEAQRLIDVTKQSFYEGLKYARVGYRLGDVGSAIQKYVESNGFSVVRMYVGHGVGKELHEDPNVPNVGSPGRGVRLERGMTIAIEPMINQGGYEVSIQPNKWTVVTKDGKLSAHYEHTIAITDGEPLILTQP